MVHLRLLIITCRLVLDIRAHMQTGSGVTHGPHIRTALPMEHRNWALIVGWLLGAAFICRVDLADGHSPVSVGLGDRG
jgi:hypothetical protein